MPNLNEQTLAEQSVLEWLKELGYSHAFGPDISPGGNFPERDSFRDVVLVKRLSRALRKLNPKVPDSAIVDAISQILKLEHPSIDIANTMMYRMLTDGVKVEMRDDSGQIKGEIIRVFDFENPANNEFLVVNQFAVQGVESVRRPDVVGYSNSNF